VPRLAAILGPLPPERPEPEPVLDPRAWVLVADPLDYDDVPRPGRKPRVPRPLTAAEVLARAERERAERERAYRELRERDRQAAIAAGATCHLCGETRYLSRAELAAVRRLEPCGRCGGRLFVEPEVAA
jgi:hypothetical protein